MVLKKPYAFLIKHFKLIHLILCIPFVYLIIRSGAIASFLSSYVNANYYTDLVNIPGTYINYFMYGAILLIVILSLAIYFLMRQKKKDTKFYIFIIIYYLFLFVAFSLCHSILGGIETASIEAQTVRIFKDLSYIVYIPQFIITGYAILRGIGFDLKKFNFEEDAKELEITDIDSEEFELTFGQDMDHYQRTLRRFFREFRYYVLENKFTFSVLTTIIIIVIGTMLYLNFGVYNKTYHQTQKISYNHLLVSVEDSILTSLDVGGKNVSSKYYLALSLRIKNTGKTASTFDYNNFQLEVAKRMLTATLDRASYFPDLGIAYTRDTKIAAASEGVYVLTYEIDKSLLGEPIVLKILDSLTFEIGSVTPIYKTVNLSYDKVYENKEVRTVEFGKILELSDTFLGLSELQLKNYQMMNSYEYTYQSCPLNICQTIKNKVVSTSTKTLLVLERMFNLDKTTNYYRARLGGGGFVKDFIHLSYMTSGEQKKIEVRDVTPKEKENIWIFEVPEEVKDASKIDIILTMRGQSYRLELK